VPPQQVRHLRAARAAALRLGQRGNRPGEVAGSDSGAPLGEGKRRRGAARLSEGLAGGCIERICGDGLDEAGFGCGALARSECRSTRSACGIRPAPPQVAPPRECVGVERIGAQQIAQAGVGFRKVPHRLRRLGRPDRLLAEGAEHVGQSDARLGIGRHGGEAAS